MKIEKEKFVALSEKDQNLQLLRVSHKYKDKDKDKDKNLQLLTALVLQLNWVSSFLRFGVEPT